MSPGSSTRGSWPSPAMAVAGKEFLITLPALPLLYLLLRFLHGKTHPYGD